MTTQRREIAEPVVRVKLAGPAYSVPISINGPFNAYSYNGRLVFQGSGLNNTQVKVEGDMLCLGNQRFRIDDYCDLIPERKGTLAVDYRSYWGWLRLYRTNDGQLIAVNHVAIEGYLRGVLPGELPARFSVECFKAQAITARTFALYEKFTAPPRKKWDVVATEGSQMYLGRSVETNKAIQAVQATRGIVLTANIGRGWKIFPAYYSSTCGGRTQSATYLANIDPRIQPLQGNVVCNSCTISPHYQWTNRVIPAAEITQSVNKSCPIVQPFKGVAAINVLSRGQNYRITKVEVVDVTGQKVVLSGERFRLVVGSRKMPSTWCNIRAEGTNFIFTDGHGLGHGVGMCQYGAEGMGQRGFTAVEILNHYYPNAKLVPAY